MVDKKFIRSYLKRYQNYNKNFIYEPGVIDDIQENRIIIPYNIAQFGTARTIENQAIIKYRNQELIKAKMRMDKLYVPKLERTEYLENFLNQINSLKLYIDKPDRYSLETQYKKILKYEQVPTELLGPIGMEVPYLSLIMYTRTERIISEKEKEDYVIMDD